MTIYPRHPRLFEFMYKYIDTEIIKYIKLAKIGIGPDAGMNAFLVASHVEELIKLMNILLKELKSPSPDDTVFKNIFNQVRFYIEQEHLRSHAGWLIDENNIHSTALDRVKDQLEELQALADEFKISTERCALPVTDMQKQCEHDSHAIAFLILDLAVRLKENPDMALAKNIPHHAAKILRHHASAHADSRYNNKEIWGSIISLHAKCQDFLANSPYTKSRELLSKDLAQENASKHRSNLEELLAQFQTIEPGSNLFSTHHQNIVNKPKTTIFSRHNLTLFGGAAIGVAVCTLIAYLTRSQDEDSLSSTFTFNA